MPGRPKPQKRSKTPARLPSEVVADNVRAYRTLRRQSQDALAARMVQLGHPQWTRAAVSELERGRRQVVVDELFALALILEKSIPDLLDPAGPGSEGRPLDVDYGVAEPLDRWAASAIATGDFKRLQVWWSDGGDTVHVEIEPTDFMKNLRSQLADARAATEAQRAKSTRRKS